MSNFLVAFSQGATDSGLTTTVGTLETVSDALESALATTSTGLVTLTDRVGLSDSGNRLEYDETAAKIFNLAQDVLGL